MKDVTMVLAAFSLSVVVIGTVFTASTVGANCKANDSIFGEVEANADYRIVYDKETKVMYSVSNGSYNRGVTTVLVDEDGNPKIWDGDCD